jgi:hypothetical protein
MSTSKRAVIIAIGSLIFIANQFALLLLATLSHKEFSESDCLGKLFLANRVGTTLLADWEITFPQR